MLLLSVIPPVKALPPLSNKSVALSTTIEPLPRSVPENRRLVVSLNVSVPLSVNRSRQLNTRIFDTVWPDETFRLLVSGR
jgi:hypothetical protein